MPVAQTANTVQPQLAAHSSSSGSRRARPLLVLETMRLNQWSKNAVVFVGLLFSGQVVQLDPVLTTLVVAFAFCLVSGATYLINDVVDADADRENSRTASRPIARGDLAPNVALVAASFAALAGMALAAAINWKAFVTVSGYVALQIAYSNWLRHLWLIDVTAIAGGFVLRAVAGGAAIGVPVSSWLLVCTGLSALLLGLTKRRAEAVAISGTRQPGRKVLRTYSVGRLDELIAVVATTILSVYCLYAVIGAASDLMLLTVPSVIYGIRRVLFLIRHRGDLTDEPAVLVWRDRPLLLCVGSWVICAGAIVAATSAVPAPA